MSIDLDVSSEVAAALLAAEGETPRDARQLAEVVREVHSTLRRLEAESRRRTRRPAGASDEPDAGRAAAG